MSQEALTPKEEDRLVWATAEKPFPQSPSFERRVTTLVATFLFLLCGMADQYAKGVFFAAVTIGSGELLLLIFRNGFAFEVMPASLDESSSSLDGFLHPAVLMCYVIVSAGLLLLKVTDPGLVVASLVATTLVGEFISGLIKSASDFMESVDEGSA